MDQALCIWDLRVNWLLIIVAAILAVVIYYSVRVGWSSLRLRLRGRRTRGKVIVVSRRSGGESGPEFQPWIRFKTNTGQAVTFADEWQGDDFDAVGTEIPVIYDPARPTDVEVVSNLRLIASPIFLISMAVVCLWALTQLDCSPSWSSGRNSAKCNSGWLGATGCGPPP